MSIFRCLAGIGLWLTSGHRGTGRRILGILPFFQNTLMLSLIDANRLVQKHHEIGCSSDSGDGVLDVRLEAFVEQEAFRAVVKVQWIDEGLEFSGICGS